MSGIGSIKKLTLSEINARLSAFRQCEFTWSENIYIPDEWEINDIDQFKLNEISEKLIPLDSLCVCFMDAETGYGVYTTHKVPQGSLILYSGIIKKFAREKLYYGMAAGESFVVDGQCQSGFADLFQDLFEPKLDRREFSQEVACNNFIAKTLSLSCGSIPLLEAAIDIPPLSQCGVSYGKQFWEMQYKLHTKQKRFYSLSGKII